MYQDKYSQPVPRKRSSKSSIPVSHKGVYQFHIEEGSIGFVMVVIMVSEVKQEEQAVLGLAFYS